MNGRSTFCVLMLAIASAPALGGTGADAKAAIKTVSFADAEEEQDDASPSSGFLESESESESDTDSASQAIDDALPSSDVVEPEYDASRPTDVGSTWTTVALLSVGVPCTALAMGCCMGSACAAVGSNQDALSTPAPVFVASMCGMACAAPVVASSLVGPLGLAFLFDTPIDWLAGAGAAGAAFAALTVGIGLALLPAVATLALLLVPPAALIFGLVAAVAWIHAAFAIHGAAIGASTVGVATYLALADSPEELAGLEERSVEVRDPLEPGARPFAVANSGSAARRQAY